MSCPRSHPLKLRSRCYMCDTCADGAVKIGPSLCCPACDYDTCPHHFLNQAAANPGAQWNRAPSLSRGPSQTSSAAASQTDDVPAPPPLPNAMRNELVLKNVRCPKGGHPLALRVREHAWICDHCEKHLPQGTVSCCCLTCDYDECAHHSTCLSESATKPEPGLCDPMDEEELRTKMQQVMSSILSTDVGTTGATVPFVAATDGNAVFRVLRSRFPGISQQNKTKRRTRRMPPFVPAPTGGGPWVGGISSTQWTKPSVYHSPYVSIKNDPHSKAVYISHCAISASVTPFIARCTVTLTFTNNDDRDLEGEVIFPLPEDAAVCGYALEFGGQMVPASLVESKKAEKVYEAEVKKGNDPGLMQKVAAGGNSFKTRVYPLPAQGGTRRVSLTYTQPLDTGIAADYGMFSFGALTIGERQEQPVDISLQADIVSPSGKVPLLEGEACPGARMALDQDPEDGSSEFADANTAARSFFVSYKEQKHTAQDTTLRVAVPHPSGDDPVILVEAAADGDGWYYLINDVVAPTPPVPSAVTCRARKLCIVWDASLSRVDAKIADELDLLGAILQSCEGNASVIDVFVVRNDVEVHKNLEPAAAMDVIRNAPLDGATNLQKLNDHHFSAAYLSGFERVLLFSDGQSTMGEGRILCLEPGNDGESLPPIYTINSSVRFNTSQLQHYWASSTGGALLHVTADMPSDKRGAMASRVLGDMPLPRILSVESEVPGVAEDCNPIKPTGISGTRFTVTGHIPQSAAPRTSDASIPILIEVGSSSHTSDVREYLLPPLDGAQPSAENVVSLLWAQQRLVELEVFPDHHGSHILDLGRRFGLVTARSSLLVLETLEQHLEHRIEPHPARVALCADYNEHLAESLEDEEKRARRKVQEDVMEYWESRDSWLKTKFSLPPKVKEVRTKSTENRSLRSRGTTRNAPRRKAAKKSAKKSKKCKSAPAAVQEEDDCDDDDEMDASSDGGDDAEGAVEEMMRDSLAARSAAAAPPTKGGLCKGGDPRKRSRDGAGTSSVRANTTVKYWSPDTPYLRAIKSVGARAEDQYGAYLIQRPEYQKTPAFYFDVGGFFLNPEELTPQRRAIGIRILSNIAELGLDNSRILRVLGYKLYEAKEWQLALEVFCKVALFRPQEPQSFRDLGLTFLECGRYQEAVDLLWRTVIMRVDWSFDEIEVECLWEIRDALARAKYSPHHADVRLPLLLLQNWEQLGFHKECSLDLRITMGWDQDNVDLDLHVIEPTGEEAYYCNSQTKIGGLMSRDFTQGYGPESYVLRKAHAKGQYKIKTNYYASHQPSLTGPAVAILSITTNFLRANQKTVCTLIRLNESKANGQIGTVTI